ncbi:intermembrane lipid transfer protein VPS13D-like isoform X2 [Styela clava]
MLENIAAQVLNRYIGEYVENINTQNLSIGLLRGAVELENLPLKKDALNDLDLPGIVLKSGHIGKIVLRIKSYKTIKEPWIVEIHRLQLVVGPGETTRTVDKTEEKKKKEEQKQRELEALEEKWRAKHGQNTSLYSVWYSYSSSIITTIMENLQFEIHDVHIRYEDDVTLPQKFSCGVCIKNLTSKSTDDKWIPTSGERTISEMMYKLLQLDGFSVYWDADSEMVGDLPQEELSKKLQKWEESSTSNVDMKTPEGKRSQFLLTPVCGQAKLTKNSSTLPLRSKNQPRISLGVMLGEISLHLSHTQYKQAIFLASELSRSEKRNIHKDGRPTGTFEKCAKKWWEWAIETHLKQIKKLKTRSSKSFILNRAKNNVEYVRMYEKVIKSKMDLEKMQTAESALLEAKIFDIEKDLTFHEIQILREVVFERTERLLKKQAKTKLDNSMKKNENEQNKGKGWGSWLRGWGRGWSSEKQPEVTAETTDVDKIEEKEESLDLVDLNLHDSVYKDLNEDELYEMFGEELSEKDTNDTFLKRDSVFLNLSFSLDAGTLTLHEDGAETGDPITLESVPFIGVEFRDVSATTEWRPRYKSSEMRVDLGGLFVKDLSNKRSCFSELIKPQVDLLDSVPHSPREAENVMSSSIKGLFDLLSSNKEPRELQSEKSTVFSLLYQNKPRTETNRFTNRLEIASAPIVITFLPNLVERVKGFFKSAESSDDSVDIDDGISATAIEKYEAWKQQSQAEIKRTVKRMMDGKTTTNVSQDKWAVTLNISAPEIIFPEDSTDNKSNVVIANLGHMTFKNHNEDDYLSKWKNKSSLSNTGAKLEEIVDDDDEEDFVTPPDTPPIMEEESLVEPDVEQDDIMDGGGLLPPGIAADDLSESSSQQRLNEKLFYERMYEQYQMHFTDLQVLVARNDEKWEATRTQGKGPHHLVERFSVDLLLERRVVPTLDPKCPAVKLKGNLPNLTIHLSHTKVHSLFNCLDRFSQKPPESTSVSSMSKSPRPTSSRQSDSPGILPENFSKIADTADVKISDEKAKSKQLLCQFSMNEISVLLEESPTSILSVLEVRRIQAEITKRPYDHETGFSIHSLLLIDTKQDIGHDYELLLASHRSVKMDLGSGNILDSGTTSPDFNGPPISNQHSDIKTISSTKNMLSSVASSLKQANIFNFSGEQDIYPNDNSGNSDNYLPGLEAEEDLITMEWKVEQLVDKNRGKSVKTRNNANIQFNNLDLVLNLKSWVAVLDFLHRLKPSESETIDAKPISFNNSVFEHADTAQSSDNFQAHQHQGETVAHTSGEDSNVGVDTDVVIEFRKLNILLMRHIEGDKVIGRKVATLSMHNTKVLASLGDKLSSVNKQFDTLMDVHGSVGGLALQDLTNAVKDESGILRAMQVLCLGDLPEDLNDSSVSNMSSVTSHATPPSADIEKSLNNEKKIEAFSFTMQKVKRKLENRNRSKPSRNDEELVFSMDSDEFGTTDYQEETILNLHLASVLYMHSPRFVAEILALTDEAGDVINAKMTVDTKQAYKEMAFSIMDKSIAVLGKSVVQLPDDVDGTHSKTKLSSGSLPSLFKLKVVMQSPIVALPKSLGSFELLVGNLGTITVRNGHALERYRPEEDAFDFMLIEITDMNVSSKRQVEEELKAKRSPGIHKKFNIKKSYSGPSLAKLKDSNSLKNKNFSEIQILHDTSIRLTVVKKPFIPSRRKKLDQRFPKKGDDGILLSDEVNDGPISDKKMCVTARMTLPLALSLSKPVYEQVLKTLDHISFGGNIDVDGIDELEGSMMTNNDSINISMNSGDISEHGRSLLDSVTSQQSTPSHSREFKLFSAPGLEITPGVSKTSTETTPITTRKYTPLYADINIPEIAIQLNEDLSEGEQGVVKVTLEGFSAKFEKENRSSTYLDLTLGSLEIEDLLREENSPHRYIVSSSSHSTQPYSSRSREEYLSTSCPPFMSSSPAGPGFMSSSLPTDNIQRQSNATKLRENAQTNRPGMFRPFDSFNLASGPFGTSQATHDHQSHRSRTVSNESGGLKNEEEPWTPPSSPTMKQSTIQDETLVRIRAFLVDGKSLAYDDIYARTNRRIDIDFNSLDCKINLQTWVVLLDFFGIGTAPKKQYELDRQTEEEYNWDRRLAVSSYYENQPDDFINSEIDFKVHSFNLIFNKEEYEFVKANISNFGTHIQIKNGVLGVAGQLGSLSVLDLSPNGNKYRERFVFAGDKALDFDIKKYDEYDAELRREFDIQVKIRMSAICYVHTHRFHQELVAYLLHFQQLQEVLGRMRAASVGQAVSSASRRQARILLDIEADSPVLLIPESSHSDRLVVADLGNLTVQNSFKWNGDPGTLSQDIKIQHSKQENPDTSTAPLSPGSRKCLLDVLHADLDQMDLYSAVRSDKKDLINSSHSSDDDSIIMFSSFYVKRDTKPLLKEKCKLSLQIERNLEKETMVRNVPDTSISGQLSSVYCTIDLQQYWLVRGILDHNLGEPIPEFPQPTAFLQPSVIQTVLSGSVYTGMSIDMHLLNVSVELLKQHRTTFQNEVSLARLDYVKSRLSYRSFSNQTKTVNLSCEAFVASDTRWKDGSWHNDFGSSRSVFSTVLGPTDHSKQNKNQESQMKDSKLQFELQFREGPDFLYFTALLVEMRVYIIADWLSDVYRYIIVNPAQEWCDSLRAKAAELLDKYDQVVPGQEQQKEAANKRDEQFKLNVTNTDFVLVENSSNFNSDAVILRMTAVLHHNPTLSQIVMKKSQEHRKIVSCTLQSLEVFSCQLDCENETALSIVDPVKVNIEIDSLKKADLTDEEFNFDHSLLRKNKLEVQISEMNTRVSYNDLLLFLAIMKSLSTKDNEEVKPEIEDKGTTKLVSVFQPSEKHVDNLCQLGYSRNDVVKSLQNADGDVQRAAEWLLGNAKVLPESEIMKLQDQQKESKKVPFDIGKMFLHVNSMCICLIDDCADCDVPLAELAVRSLSAEQNLSFPDPEQIGPVPICYAGKAHFILSGDYYNRMLSLWEPYLEPWRCGLKWNYITGSTLSSTGKWNMNVQASDRLDITVTSTLIETIKKTKETWTTSFKRTTNQPQSENLIDFGQPEQSFARKRREFVPYVLRNLTGEPLNFKTHVSTIQKPSSSIGQRGGTSHSSTKQDDSWIMVMPGDSHPFRFDRSEKQRHKRSDETILHQIIAKIGEWETLSPVTISKVGVYFRHATEEIVKSSSVYRPPDPVRVVFAVTLEGSAQKVITVRSALVIRSKIKIPVQICLISGVEKPIVMPRLDPGGVQYIPLQLTAMGIKIRPVHSSKNLFRPCSQTIHWNKMSRDLESTSDIVTCQSETNKDVFRFAVCIKKKNYPLYEDVMERFTDHHQHGPGDVESMAKFGYVPPHMPGHTIIILPPVVVSNLLPCDMHYFFKDTQVGGKLMPGQDATLHCLNLVPGSIEQSSNHPLLLGCALEGFRECRELTITHMERNAQMRMAMLDHQNRTLILNVRVFWRLGCSVKISIMAGYWIVNKTGLPIILKQEGAKVSFAGQYDEHERARSMTPLLFSYSDRDLPYLCTMRLGKEAAQDLVLDNYASKYPQSRPSTPYCQSFSIDGGTCTRNLKMVNHDYSPSRVYYIGVGVRRGWGRYMHTHIVTLAPRFLLVNLTKNSTLSFAQLHATSFTDDAAGLNRHLTIIPGSSIVFHWPRADLDLLLCTRLSEELNCKWSGGFVIDRIDAFHVHLRIFGGSKGNHSIFLRVEITLVDATYRVMFYDGDISSCPSPLRIDNISAAPLVVRQCDTDEGLQITVAPSSQVPYACDEPCLPPIIDCRVEGVAVSVQLNMDNIDEEKVLYYENFIYIVVGRHSSSNSMHNNPVYNEDQLVLTVHHVDHDWSVDQTRHLVTLEKRRTGNRSQLWRMTSEGYLRHEGSSPPGGRSKYPSSSTRQGLVLDIAEMAIHSEVMPLTIRNIDSTRKSQIWSFGVDGRLSCGYKNLCVQKWANDQVGLAPYLPDSLATPNQYCRSEKMIAGSGVLALKVVRDGPTRVIRVMDIHQKRAGISRDSSNWVMMTRQHSSHSVDPSQEEKTNSKSRKISLNIDLAKGVGFSLISNAPEELLYLTMSGVRLEASLDEKIQKFGLKIQRIQIDNQLLGGRPPVMLHPYKSAATRDKSQTSTNSSATDPQPALSIEAVKLPSTNSLYEIYRSLSINIGRMCLQLEEILLLKLIQFFGSGLSPETDLSLLDETRMDLIQNATVSKIMMDSGKRYYFDSLIVSIQPMQLSMFTASRSHMDLDLKQIKQSSSLMLIQFERAPVTMQPYERKHVFETTVFIVDEAKKHFTEQLRGQAARILGAVDFLGNPIGLLSDLKAGLGSMVQGKPGSLLKHVTHGLSNSAAKFTGSLSTFAGGITMDQNHEEKRRAIRSNPNNATDHFVAGLQSLGTGLVGGLTSIVTQTVRGASDEGAKGFFTGFGKGLVGTVTKPVTGVLDFASETASFVRDSSISSDMNVKKVRLPRTCHSFQGCLECFSDSRSESQQFLYSINGSNYDEWIYSFIEINRRGKESMLFLVTNKRVYLMRNKEPDPDGISLRVNYQDLLNARPVSQQAEWGLELAIKMDTRSDRNLHYSASSSSLHSQRYGSVSKKPQIICHSETTARRICDHVNYAKMLASEQAETLPISSDDTESDKAFDLEV